MGFVIILLLLVAATLLALRSIRAALLVTIFLAPWNSIQADFGVTVYAYQLALLPLTGVVLLRSLNRPPMRLPAGGLLALYVVFAVIVSLAVIGFLPEAAVAGGGLRGPTARAAIQIVAFLFTLAPVVVIPLAARRDDLAACGRIFIASALVLAVIGWGQLAIWYATGSNPIDVARISAALGGSDVYSHEGFFDFAKLSIYRMNSLAGEPRQLGITLVLAMLIIQGFALSAPRPRTLQLVVVWLFLLVSTLATYSTSAAGVWLIGSALQLPAMWITGIRSRRSTIAITGALLVIAAPVAIGIAAAEASGLPVIALLSERTIDRIDENGAVEDFDLAIIDYLTAHPDAAIAGTGLGNIHLYATAYLDPQFAIYAQGNVFAAKTAYLRLISETGVIGLALFLLWYGRLTLLAARALRPDPALAALAPFGVLMFAIYFARAEIYNDFFLTAGLLGAAAGLRPQAAAPVAIGLQSATA